MNTVTTVTTVTTFTTLTTVTSITTVTATTLQFPPISKMSRTYSLPGLPDSNCQQRQREGDPLTR